MTTSLERWPPEVFEQVLKHLMLDELRNFRLVSKTIAALVAQETFKQYYRTKHVDVSPRSLRDFVYMTQSGRQGRQIENLILTGLAVDVAHLQKIVKEKARWVTEGNGPLFCSMQHKLSDDELARAKGNLEALQQRNVELEQFVGSGADVELLAQAFRNIAAFGHRGKLRSLQLQVGVLKESVDTTVLPVETRGVSVKWQASQGTFRTAMVALAQSRLPLEKLDAVTEQFHCSLSWRVLDCIRDLPHSGLSESLKGLRTLSLSLSADNWTAQQRQEDENAASVDARSSSRQRALVDLLAFCPLLQHLHIHWFMLRSAGYEDDSAQRLLHRIAETGLPQSLRSLILRGIRCEAVTLLRALKGARVKDLRLENVHVDESKAAVDGGVGLAGSTIGWQEIFAHCASSEANMKSLYFDDLWAKRLVHFMNVAGKQKFPWTPPARGSPILDRKGDDIRDKIEWYYPSGRPLGSPQAYRWRVLREREYGPA